jgi:uncharacterized protein
MEPKLNYVEYQKALKGNRLTGLKCRDCGCVNAPPRMTCRKCSGTDMDIVELTGKGKIKTFTTIHVPSGARKPGQDIVIMVELTEGPWIMGNLGGIEPQAASMKLIGRPVKLNNVTPDTNCSLTGDAAPLFVLE